MKITNVSIKNFMSIGDIELDMSKNGLYLVLGRNLDDNKSYDSNGAGKSSIFYALCWNLYSFIFPDIGLENIIRNGTNEVVVSTTIDPEDGSESVVITRTRTKSKSAVTVETKNSKTPLFPADSVKDIQLYIDNWLGMDFKTFTNSVYFGKGLVKFFMASSDSEKKDLLDSVLQIISFDDALERSKTKVKSLETDKIKASSNIDTYKVILEDKYNEYRRAKSALTSAQEYMTNDEPALNFAMEMDKASINSVSKDIAALNSDISAKYEELEKKLKEVSVDPTLLSIVEDRAKVLEKVKSDYKALKETVDYDYSLQFSSLKKERDQLAHDISDSQIQLADISFKLKDTAYDKNKLSKELFQLTNNTNTVCDSCNQTLPVESKNKRIEIIKKELVYFDKFEKETNERKEKLTKEVSIIQNKITEIDNTIATLNFNKATKLANLDTESLEASREATKKFDQEIFDKRAKIEETKTALREEFNNKVLDNKNKIIELTSSKMTYENQLARAKQQLKDLQTELKTCESTFKRVKEERDSYKTKIEENEQILVTVSKDLEKASFWVEAFGPRGIRSFIFENALPYLSEKANTYSTILTGGTVTIDILPTTPLKNGTTKEKLFVSAKNSFGANVYAGNSDGERRRIDICILLALQDLIASRASKVWNTIIFDEVMDTLDKTGIQNVIELLRTYQNKNIFLISHSEDLKQYFDTAIIVQKENGVSKLL